MASQMKKHSAPYRSIVLAFIFILLPFIATAQVHPSKTWRTLSLEHFELIYDAQNQPLAELYAERLQHLKSPLREYWQDFPQKTVFVLNDRTDLTNGYATFLPYPLIMIFPVVPGPMESIGEYDDWAWEIGVHEYIHILEFSQRRGLVWGLSYVFGSIMTPNALLPRWSLEGAAVEAETRFSNAGRLRSKMQAGTLRSLGQSGRLDTLRLAEINEFAIPTWPYGARPYLFGSILWSDWTESYGPKAVGDFHQNTGGRVPYFLDGAFEPVFEGLGQIELFERSRTKMIEAAKSELQTLSQVPLSNSQQVDPEMTESLSPNVSPDGLKLAYIAKNETLRRRIQVLLRPQADTPFDPSHRIQWFGKEFDQALPSGSPLPRGSISHGAGLGSGHGPGDEPDDGPPGGNITRISWHPSSTSFVFDQVIEKNRFQDSSDLWSFDLNNGKATRLTTDLRAREPSYSPDASRIAYVQIVAGRTDLAIFDLETKTTKVHFQSKAQGRVSFPVWLNATTILFSSREQGLEQILRLDLATGSTTPILGQWKQPQFLSVEKDFILFTSTQNGVRNLYRSNFDFTDVKPVTHSPGHVLLSSFDSSLKRYYFTELTAEAFQIKYIEESEALRLPAELPKVGSHWGDRYPAVELPFKPEPEALTLTANATAYSPWSYLWPRYWLPFVAWDDRGTYVTVSTSGADPLQKHAYSVQGSYDSAIQRGSYIFGYANQSFWPLLSLSSYDYSLQLAIPGEYSRAQLTQVMASWELERFSHDWFVGIGANAGSREKFGRASKRASPLLTTSYRNAFQSGNQVSPEAGWLGSLQLSAPRDLDLNRTFAVAEASGTYFWSRWLPRRHVVMLKGQLRSSDELLQVEYMEQSVSFQSTTNTPFPEYLNRGYASGTFLGRNMGGVTLEYRLPIRRLDASSDGYPFYFHRMHGALVADGTFFDGFVFDTKSLSPLYRRNDSGRGFWSYGAEVRFDMNIGYHVPITFGLGVYAPLDTEFTEGGPRIGTFLIL